MSKIIFAGVATIAMLVAPTLAGAQGEWRVILDADTMSCNASDEAPDTDESEVGGPFATEAEAEAAINNIAACNQSMEDDDDDDG